MIIEQDGHPYFEHVIHDNCFAGFTLRGINPSEHEWLDHVLTRQISEIYEKGRKDCMEEITLSTKTLILEVQEGELKSSYEIDPADFGFKVTDLGNFQGGKAIDNSKILLEILKNKVVPARDIVVMNSAADIYVAGGAGSIKEAIKVACASIESGKALEKLELLKEYSNK